MEIKKKGEKEEGKLDEKKKRERLVLIKSFSYIKKSPCLQFGGKIEQPMTQAAFNERANCATLK